MQAFDISSFSDQIKSISNKYHLKKMSLFGSSIQGNFNDKSDVDILIDFIPGSHVSLLELSDLQTELESLFRRSVDLVETEGLRNPYRRKEILKNAKVVYEA